jgi:hypothetical protein
MRADVDLPVLKDAKMLRRMRILEAEGTKFATKPLKSLKSLGALGCSTASRGGLQLPLCLLPASPPTPDSPPRALPQAATAGSTRSARRSTRRCVRSSTTRSSTRGMRGERSVHSADAAPCLAKAAAALVLGVALALRAREAPGCAARVRESSTHSWRPHPELPLSAPVRRSGLFGGTRSRKVVHRLALFDKDGQLTHVVSQTDVIR